MKITRTLGAVAALFTASLLFTQAAKAQTPIPNLSYNVTISNLNVLPFTNGEYFLDLNLITGSGNVTNTVTLSNFTFTGGGVDASNPGNYTNGNVTGSFASSIVFSSLIGEGGQVNELTEAFSTNVTSISFNVNATINDEVVGNGVATPDQFYVDVQDTNGTYIPTTDASASTLVSETIASTNNSASVQYFNGTGAAAGVTAVPEPSTYLLFGLGALALVIAYRRRSA
jgi:hypothetical protein